MSNKKRRKPIIVDHLKSLMMVILKKKNPKRCQSKTNKTKQKIQDSDNSRVLTRKHAGENR